MAAPTAFRMSVRRWILTGSIAAIAITGSIYGAELKSAHEANQVRLTDPLPSFTSIYIVELISGSLQERKRVLQLGPDERIAQLDAARSDLVMRKNELERKLAQVKGRRMEKEGAKEADMVKSQAQMEGGGAAVGGAEENGKQKMLSQGWTRWLKW